VKRVVLLDPGGTTRAVSAPLTAHPEIEVEAATDGAALRSGTLAGCAPDVLPVEPPPADEPARDWPRTLLNPHMAYYSPESADAPYRMGGEAVAAVLEGREPFGALARPGRVTARARPAT
jgi:hypothetical protein